MQQFIDYIAESAPVLAPVVDVVSEGQAKSLRAAGVGEYHVQRYMDAQMDINYVLLRAKTRPLGEVMESALCSPRGLEKLVRIKPADAQSLQDLSNGLCLYHKSVTAGLDVGRMERLLPGLRARQPRDGDWLGGVVREGRRLVESASRLRSESRRLMDAADLQLSELTPKRAWDLLYSFQRSDLRELLRSAERVVDSSGRLMGGSEAELELERLLRGVFGLRDLQSFAASVLRQPYSGSRMELEVRSFLQDSLGIPAASLDRWEDLHVDLRKVCSHVLCWRGTGMRRVLFEVISGALDARNQSAVLCSQEELLQLLPRTNESLVSDISAQLCPLAERVEGFGPRLLERLDIGAFFRRV